MQKLRSNSSKRNQSLSIQKIKWHVTVSTPPLASSLNSGRVQYYSKSFHKNYFVTKRNQEIWQHEILRKRCLHHQPDQNAVIQKPSATHHRDSIYFHIGKNCAPCITSWNIGTTCHRGFTSQQITHRLVNSLNSGFEFNMTLKSCHYIYFITKSNPERRWYEFLQNLFLHLHPGLKCNDL